LGKNISFALLRQWHDKVVDREVVDAKQENFLRNFPKNFWKKNKKKLKNFCESG
jgi:hypothetical protein